MFPRATEAGHKYSSRYSVSENFLDVDGDKIHVLRVGDAGADAPQILYFHGNGENNLVTIGFAEKLLSNFNANVWLIDYPGYGKSSGTVSSQEQLERGAGAFVEYVKSQAHGPLYAVGFSMGTYFANYAAEKYNLDRLVLMAPYLSAKEQIKDFSPYFPTWLLRYDLKNFEVLPKVKGPVLLVHGSLDDQVHHRHVEALKKSSPQAKLLLIEGAHHNDLPDHDEFWDALKEFFH